MALGPNVKHRKVVLIPRSTLTEMVFAVAHLTITKPAILIAAGCTYVTTLLHDILEVNKTTDWIKYLYYNQQRFNNYKRCLSPI